MVNTLSQGWVTDRVDVVKGLAQGTSTAAEWNYTDDTLTNRLTGGSNYGTFADKTMIKFRMGEDGVLKDFVRLDQNVAYDTNRNNTLSGDEKNPTVIGASFGAYTRGGGGTFTLTVSPSAVAIGAVPAGTNPYYQPGSNMTGVVPDKITFEADTVLYKRDGANNTWTAYRPDGEGKFKADVDVNGNINGVYMFLKTDTKKEYDVIIKLN
jgi:hypothetical protein